VEGGTDCQASLAAEGSVLTADCLAGVRLHVADRPGVNGFDLACVVVMDLIACCCRLAFRWREENRLDDWDGASFRAIDCGRRASRLGESAISSCWRATLIDVIPCFFLQGFVEFDPIIHTTIATQSAYLAYPVGHGLVFRCLQSLSLGLEAHFPLGLEARRNEDDS
jgi:hypothetical protein